MRAHLRRCPWIHRTHTLAGQIGAGLEVEHCLAQCFDARKTELADRLLLGSRQRPDPALEQPYDKLSCAFPAAFFACFLDAALDAPLKAAPDAQLNEWIGQFHDLFSHPPNT